MFIRENNLRILTRNYGHSERIQPCCQILYKFDSEEELNDMGYILLAENQVESAIKIFQLLVAEFPNASNPHDSLGEAYYLNKQYDLSLKSYQKSLDIDPNYENAKGAREIIEEIKGMK